MQNVVRRSGSIDLDRRRPSVTLVSRVGIFENGVADDIAIDIDRRLFPDRVKITGLINRHGREISTGLRARSQVGDKQVRAIQSARIADIGYGRAKSDRETPAHRDLV